MVAKSVPDNIIISDATVLINFLETGQFGVLLKVLKGRFHVTDFVRAEITHNKQDLETAISCGEIQEHKIPLDQVVHLVKSFASFDPGEASCFVLAREKSWRVATDDGAAKAFVKKELGASYVVTTFDILMEGIDLGIIKKGDASTMLQEMEQKAYFQYHGQDEYKTFIHDLKRK